VEQFYNKPIGWNIDSPPFFFSHEKKQKEQGSDMDLSLEEYIFIESLT